MAKGDADTETRAPSSCSACLLNSIVYSSKGIAGSSSIINSYLFLSVPNLSLALKVIFLFLPIE